MVLLQPERGDETEILLRGKAEEAGTTRCSRKTKVGDFRARSRAPTRLWPDIFISLAAACSWLIAYGRVKCLIVNVSWEN